ncbi:hypothetical protein RB600_004616 [Gaeumannomyces tritici]
MAGGLTMLRIRRYRVFVVGAIILLFLLLRVSQNSQWEGRRSAIYNSYTHPGTKGSEPTFDDQKQPSQPARGHKPEQLPVGPEPRPRPKLKSKPKPQVQALDGQPKQAVKHHDAAPGPNRVQIPELKPDPESRNGLGRAKAAAASESPSRVVKGPPGKTPVATPKAALEDVDIPDRETDRDGDLGQKPLDKGPDRLHAADPPSHRQKSVALSATLSVPHWRKMPEHFPVPKEDVIPLPTGKPTKMPPVQHSFEKAESLADREKREGRLAQVKKEMQRAWNGYRKYAWGHDELEPVTKGFRDPFCGWAATLVDSMDTLWIMGMKEEFEDAYRALDKIDFTTTPYRREIPVFETIIRYLGGLLAAYDVSGGPDGKHPKLLKKAVELAEVLMSIFDTPNRMPVLYYNWMPRYASQPRRASASSGVAELGSMSMEFTRLAQLTGEDRYYDAIARITNAFEEWQNRGTVLNGIFPQQVDAAGCNRTAPSLTSLDLSSVEADGAEVTLDASKGYSPIDSTETNNSGEKSKSVISDGDPQFKVHPGDKPGSVAKAEFKEKPAEKKLEARRVIQGLDGADDTPPSVPKAKPATVHADRVGASGRGGASGPYGASNRLPDWDCTPQGLTDGGYGSGSFGMGGSQDSTYEYFPKQYILLGGLEPKYKSMHLKVVAAVKKYLLYRPMIKDEDRSLLFSASVYASSQRGVDKSYTYEVTHLTCFLGGMFALGGRVFGSAEDVEIGARLTDGCVWAYESTPSGLMPEGGAMVPCQTVASCPWNETVWYEHLDPSSQWRDSMAKDYEIRKKEWDEQKASLLKAEALRVKAEKEAKRSRPTNSSDPLGRFDDDADADGQNAGRPRQQLDSDDFTYSQGKAVLKKSGKEKLRRSPPSHAGRYDDSLVPAPAPAPPSSTEDKPKTGQPGASILDGAGAGRDGAQSPLAGAEEPEPPYDPLWELPPEPTKPQTHEEYVRYRIKQENLPPGYTGMNDRRYILRPEAIESVWYMYRITGDKKWQEKGWRMFKAVIRATQTEHGHSAVDNVHSPTSPPSHLNNMESFWMAETLKYFYLLYTTPDVISLDDWVLNTEAHPFKRPT